MKIQHSIILLIAAVFFGCNTQPDSSKLADKVSFSKEWEISKQWILLSCSGHGYLLEFNNDIKTFKVSETSEGNATTYKVYKGTFIVNDKNVTLNFGEFVAHCYIKKSISEINDNVEDSLAASERERVCDESKMITRKDESFGASQSATVFLKETGLFIKNIEYVANDVDLKELINDLNRYCFVLIR